MSRHGKGWVYGEREGRWGRCRVVQVGNGRDGILYCRSYGRLGWGEVADVVPVSYGAGAQRAGVGGRGGQELVAHMSGIVHGCMGKDDRWHQMTLVPRGWRCLIDKSMRGQARCGGTAPRSLPPNRRPLDSEEVNMIFACIITLLVTVSRGTPSGARGEDLLAGSDVVICYYSRSRLPLSTVVR